MGSSNVSSSTVAPPGTSRSTLFVLIVRLVSRTSSCPPGRRAGGRRAGRRVVAGRHGVGDAPRLTRGPEEGGPPTAYVLGQELGVKVFERRARWCVGPHSGRGLQGGLTDEAPWLLLGVKTLSYAVNMAAKRWAESRGADDAIFVGADGVIWEAASSAVITTRDGRLVSPPASLGILDSISVTRLFLAAEHAGWEVARDQVTMHDLFEADGVWLSSSLRFAHVHKVDGKALADAPNHEELAALAATS